MRRLLDKSVVITGASACVGRAAARAFALAGSNVALIARGRGGLDATRREITGLGRRALAIAADVADHDQVEEAADCIEREWGGVDVWVNNAMASVLSPVLDTTPEEFRRVTEVTYLGCVHGTLSALRRMVPRDRPEHTAVRLDPNPDAATTRTGASHLPAGGGGTCHRLGGMPSAARAPGRRTNPESNPRGALRARYRRPGPRPQCL
jgi:NAD(P)-dependent dehydrogenase (short-subunit alcohol dehydrogenase family)